jgi:hypothetical protein
MSSKMQKINTCKKIIFRRDSNSKKVQNVQQKGEKEINTKSGEFKKSNLV